VGGEENERGVYWEEDQWAVTFGNALQYSRKEGRSGEGGNDVRPGGDRGSSEM